MSTDHTIARETWIAAPLQRVWDFVVVPGWYIGGDDKSGQTLSREDDLDVLDDPRYGRFTLRVETLEPLRHIAFRCGFAPPGEPLQDPNAEVASLVQFHLSERDGGTLVQVSESGFEPFIPKDQTRDQYVDGNNQAWELQLGIAKAQLEQVPAANRPLGLWAGQVQTAPDFDEMPEEMAADFRGERP